MEDKLIWSQTITQDSLAEMPEEELRDELANYSYEPEMLATLDYEGLQDLVYSDDSLCDMDFEDLNENIIPKIAEQTYNDILILAGAAQTWQGHATAGTVMLADELFNNDRFSEYEVAIVDNNGQLMVKASHHDGTNLFGMYTIPENVEEFILNCMPDAVEEEMQYVDSEEEAIDSVIEQLDDIDYLGNHLDFNVVPEYGAPITNNITESCNESCLKEDEVTIKDFIDSESAKGYSPENIAKKYNIEFVGREAGNGGEFFKFKGAKENLNKYLDAYGGPDADELVDESLNEDETMTSEQAKKYWEENKDSDPVLADYNSYEDWVKDSKENGYIKDESVCESEDHKFIDTRKNAILGQGDDYGFDEYDVEYSDDIDEAKSKNPENLEMELQSIKDDYEDFGPDGFYAVPFKRFSSEYPEFTKSCIMTYLKELEILEPEELKDPQIFEDYWQTGELILPEDWPILIEGAEKLSGDRADKGYQWITLLKKYRKPFDAE